MDGEALNGPPVVTSREFTTTHWSVVLAAGQSGSLQADEALENLCRTYWYPLYGYVRRQGHSPEDAQDLTLSRSVRDTPFLCIRNSMPHLSWNQPEGYSDNAEMGREITRLAGSGGLDSRNWIE